MKNIFFTGLFTFFVFIVNGQSVRPTWTFEAGGPVLSSAVSVGNSLFIGSDDGYMYCLNGQNGKLNWKTKVDGAIRCEPAIYEDVIIFSTAQGTLYALNLKKGDVSWKFTMGQEQQKDMWDYFYSSPIVYNGDVFVGCGNGKLYSIDPENGKKNFEFATDGIVHVKPVVYKDRIYFGSYDGFFYGINASDGSLAWKFDTHGQEYFKKGAVQNNAAVVDGSILFGSRDFKVYSLDADNGSEQWNMHEKGSWVSAPITIDGKAAYFGTSDSHNFYKLNSRDGKVMWQAKVPLNIFGGATVVGGVIYVGCLDGCLYGFSTDNGERVFQFKTPANKMNANLLLNESGEKIDREKLKKYKTGDKFYGDIYSMGSIFSTPLHFQDKLVFGSYEGVIYAISVE